MRIPRLAVLPAVLVVGLVLTRFGRPTGRAGGEGDTGGGCGGTLPTEAPGDAGATTAAPRAASASGERGAHSGAMLTGYATCAGLGATAVTSMTAQKPAFISSTGAQTLNFNQMASGATPTAGATFNPDEYAALGVHIHVISSDPTVHLDWVGNTTSGFEVALASSRGIKGTGNIVVTFDTPLAAVGFDYPGNVEAIFTSTTGATIADTGNIPGSGTNFVGLSSNVPVSSVTLVRAGANVLNGLEFTNCRTATVATGGVHVVASNLPASTPECLDIYAGSSANGAVADQDVCGPGAATPSQTWGVLSTASPHQFQLVNSSSHLCLEVNGGGSTIGESVDQWNCLPNHPNEVWTLTPVPGSSPASWQLQNVASSLCLESVSGSIGSLFVQDTCNLQSAKQQFILPAAVAPFSLPARNDFSGLNLTGANLAGLDLSTANLTGVISGGITGPAAGLPPGFVLSGGYLIGPGANLSGINVTTHSLSFTGLDLAGANLSGAVLAGVTSGGIIGTPAALPAGWAVVAGYLVGPTADLEHADLTNANLTGQDLSGARMNAANLTNAVLTGANINGTALCGATLTGVISDRLIGTPACLPKGWVLLDGDLLGPSSANLADASFAGAQLAGVNLAGVNVTGVNFAGATLTGATFTGATLTGANLTNANLTNANLSGANVTNASLTNASLTNANLTNANLTGANLTGVISGGITCDLPAALPPGFVLRGGYLFGPGVNLSGINVTTRSLPLTGLDLAGANLSGAVLGGVTSGGIIGTPAALPAGWAVVAGYLVGPTADLEHADLTNANLTGQDLSGARMNAANLTNATLTGANISGTGLCGATFTGVLSGGLIGIPACLPTGWTLVNGGLVAPAP